MKKTDFLLWAFLLCLLLAACGNSERETPQAGDPPPEEQTQPEEERDIAPSHEAADPAVIDHLTVELAVDWEDADRLLPELDDLSRLLQEGLRAENYQVDEITVTLSTAGGFTAASLAEGGVDAACLPAMDYAAEAEGAYAVLTSDEDICSAVVAVTAAREELDEAFRDALAEALLQTEPGASFLDACRPGLVWVPAEEEALQAVREQLAEQAVINHGE